MSGRGSEEGLVMGLKRVWWGSGGGFEEDMVDCRGKGRGLRAW